MCGVPRLTSSFIPCKWAEPSQCTPPLPPYPPPHTRILNPEHRNSSESPRDWLPVRFLSPPPGWRLGWGAAGRPVGGLSPDCFSAQPLNRHTRVCIPPSLMPPLGTQAFRNLRRPASRCRPEGGGPRLAGVGGREGLGSAFAGNRNLRPSPPLSAALGFQARKQRALAFAKIHLGRRGLEKKSHGSLQIQRTSATPT